MYRGSCMIVKKIPSNQKINVGCVYFEIMSTLWFTEPELKDG